LYDTIYRDDVLARAYARYRSNRGGLYYLVLGARNEPHLVTRFGVVVEAQRPCWSAPSGIAPNDSLEPQS
jgi:hypothetical protein